MKLKKKYYQATLRRLAAMPDDKMVAEVRRLSRDYINHLIATLPGGVEFGQRLCGIRARADGII